MIKRNNYRKFLITFFLIYFLSFFRLEFVHADYPKWDITLEAVCETKTKILKETTKLRMFRILWPWVNPNTGQYSPFDFNCLYDTEEGNSSPIHKMSIQSENPLNNSQGIYVGLELPIRNNVKAKCSEGIAFEPYEIIPNVPNICRSTPQSGDFICFSKFFNPYNYMVRWNYDRLTPGNYTIKIKIPDEYCTSCEKKSKGDANCDGKIDGIDYSMWLNRQCTSGCGGANLIADFDGNNRVDDEDYSIWFNNRQ